MIIPSGIDMQSISASRADRLKKLTADIAGFVDTGNKFGVASTLLMIYNEKLYLEAGYKSVFQYGKDVLGYKQASISNHLRIARSYLDIQTGRTIFAHDGKDFSYTALVELLKVNVDDARIMYQAGYFDVDSSVTAVKAAVERWKREQAGIKADEEKAAMEPLQAAYDDFHKAYNELKAYLLGCEDFKGANELLPKIMDAVVVVYAEKVK